MRTIVPEFQKNMSKCFKNKIRIYPLPYGINFKIVVERKGRQKIGNNVYDKKAVNIKIKELYKNIAKKIDKNNTAATVATAKK